MSDTHRDLYAHTPHSAQAAEMCVFQLTYVRAETPRHFAPAVISGHPIPDAWGKNSGDEVCGDWNGGDTPNWPRVLEDETADAPVDEWIDHYATMAVSEAVHEALEWFQVDGRPWLDPHGQHEVEIYRLTEEFVAKIARLRGTAEKKQLKAS